MAPPREPYPSPLRRVPSKELPEEPRRWLDGSATLPGDVTWIRARAPSLLLLVVAGTIMFSMLAFGLLAMLITQPTGGSASLAFIVLAVSGIPYAVVLWMWRQQRRDAAALANPKHRFGLLLSPDVLVWAPSLDECTLFDRRLMAPVVTHLPLGGRTGHREVQMLQEVVAGGRVIVELHPEEVQFDGDARALAAHLEAWRTQVVG